MSLVHSLRFLSSSSLLPLVSSLQTRHFSVEAGQSVSSVLPASRLSSLKDSSLTLDDFISPFPSSSCSSSSSSSSSTRKAVVPKPPWLKAVPPSGPRYESMKSIVASLGLSTVCQEAKCPNIGECWSGEGTATIMLMGDTCTRGCRFCAVKTSRTPSKLDENEPEKVSEAIAKWGLGYVVLTSVDRDDLSDGGSHHIAKTIRLLSEKNPNILIECLTPDFQGNLEHVRSVASSGLHVFAHNIETVEGLQRFVRDRRANYQQSLSVLRFVKVTFPHLITKTSIMLGCGEMHEEIEQTLRDLRDAGVDVVTFGQYLRPTPKHMKVAAFIEPQAFEHWGERARTLGFLYVASGPLVRSSYKAGEFYMEHVIRQRQQHSTQQLQPFESPVHHDNTADALANPVMMCNR